MVQLFAVAALAGRPTGWLPSNPIGFANWFRTVMLEERVVLAKAAMPIAPVPEWRIKTILQRSVQALKRHRDKYFTGHLHDRPASGTRGAKAAASVTEVKPSESLRRR